MKKLILPFALLLFVVACKKDDTTSTPTVDKFACKAEEDPSELEYDHLWQWPDYAKTEFFTDDVNYSYNPDSAFLNTVVMGVLKDSKSGKHYLGIDTMFAPAAAKAGGIIMTVQVFNTKAEHVHGFSTSMAADKKNYLEDNPRTPKTSCYRAYCAFTDGAGMVVYKGHFDFSY